jgi:hypothetical protein
MSNSFKYVKFSASQSGPFSNVNKNIDLILPAGLMVDMTQSYVQLEASIDLGASSVGEVDGLPFVHNLVVRSTVSDDYTPMNVELIRQCNLRSSNKGVLESTPRINILAKNMWEMTNSTNQKLSTIDSLYQVKSLATKKLMSAFTELHKNEYTSAYVNPRLNIPLSQLVSLGNLDVFDTASNKFGSTTLHLELDNLNAFTVNKQQLTTDVDGVCEPITSANTPTNTLQLEATYDSLELVPFFTGEKVRLSFTETGQQQEVVDAVITNILYDASTRIVQIITNYQFGALTGANTYSGIVLGESIEDDELYGTFRILNAELCVALIDDPKVQSPDVINFMTFTTFEKSVNQQNYSEIVEIEPECVNLFIMQNNPTSYNKLSNNVEIESSRIRINGLDVYDRDINYNYASNFAYTHDVAYYEMLNKTFLNASMSLKNVSCVALSRNEPTIADYFDRSGLQILIICCPTPLTATQKQVQLNINAKSGEAVNNLVLFKQCMKTIKMK